VAVTTAGGSLLVVDVGTSSVRAGIVRPDARVEHVVQQTTLPSTPAPGLVELDAGLLASAVLEVAARALEAGGPVSGVGIANQRASTIVWERANGKPVGPGIGWQDLRTVGTCLELQAQGIRLAPNASATKLAAILDEVDPQRRRAADELCFGTVDSWVVWTLSEGRLHVTDATNAAVTGLVAIEDISWDPAVLEALAIPASMLPTIVDSSGDVGEASALTGSPLICGIAGDQQASLVGQGCTSPGQAKATFGTGGMLDQCTGPHRPTLAGQAPSGTFPIVAWQRGGTPMWGLEAVMLSAGTAIEWLRDDLELIDDVASSAGIAAQCADTGDVWFVPSLLGMGTPVWDFGARGTLLGLTRGTGKPQLVRAVLEGVAQRGADLLEAAEADSGLRVEALRIDGGMSANEVFVSLLADACGRSVEVSPVLEATTLGAGFLAGLAVGTWRDEADVASAFSPSRIVEPRLDDQQRAARRDRWLRARARAEQTIPELSGISF
jgi:glycerol kinase